MKHLIRFGVNIKINHKNDPFESNEFIWNSKDICNGNIHLWYQKYSLPSTKVLGVVACRVTSKILGIGYAECSWGGVKTIKSGKISTLGSDISEKQIIVYTSACVEESRIGINISNTYSKDSSHINSWNDEDNNFDCQLDQWGVEKLFQNSDEVIIRELKMYVEDWEIRISRTRVNYCVLCLLKNIVVWICMMNIWRKD